MHPSRKQIIDYITGIIKSPDVISDIRKHIKLCEFCSEVYEEYVVINDLKSDSSLSLSNVAMDSRDQLFNNSINTKTIILNTLNIDNNRTNRITLAADGQEKIKPDLENIATLISENPELVLKIMRDNKQNQDFVQLLSKDKSIIEQALIKIPDSQMELVTDSKGRVNLQTQLDDNISLDKWQIKLPQADFSLQLLDYDPDKIEYQKEMLLETETQDTIKVVFQKKTEGSQINVSIEKLAGQTDARDLQIIVSQKDKSQIKSISSSDAVSFKLTDIGDEIKIRLYDK